MDWLILSNAVRKASSSTSKLGGCPSAWRLKSLAEMTIHYPWRCRRLIRVDNCEVRSLEQSEGSSLHVQLNANRWAVPLIIGAKSQVTRWFKFMNGPYSSNGHW